MKKNFALLILTLVFLSSCTNEYIEYHKEEFGYKNESKQNINANADFNPENIESRDFDLFITPDKKSLDYLVSKIDNAKDRVYLTVYILTEKRIVKALKDAENRGLDVKVILEKNVFGAGNMNKKSFDSLTNSGVTVRYANNDNYKFTHAKYFIIDSTYIISSGNMSYSTFAYNRDLLLFGSLAKDLIILEEIFNQDLKGEKLVKCDNSLVISPICPRNQFVQSLSTAKKSIYIYAETFDDDEIMNLLAQKAKSGVDVKVVLGDIGKVKSNKLAFDKMVSAGITVIAPKRPYIHAKSFIVDDDIIYIGSINFSNNSIENNREIGVIFRNNLISAKLKNEFLTNFLNKQVK